MRHPWIPPTVALAALLLLLPSACGPAGDTPVAQASSAEGHPRPAVPEATEGERATLQALLESFVPPPLDATSDVYDSWRLRRDAALREASQGGPGLGALALETWRQNPGLGVDAQMGLVEVGARAAPEYARQDLLDLASTYGPHFALRERAIALLGELFPTDAYAFLEPLLADADRGETFPPEEHLLRAFLDAAQRTERDPTRTLALIATDMHREETARHLAVRTLGDYRSVHAREALIGTLIESTGNMYLRRLAAQSLRRAVEAEELCELLEDIIANEANTHVQIFLLDILNEDCP